MKWWRVAPLVVAIATGCEENADFDNPDGAAGFDASMGGGAGEGIEGGAGTLDGGGGSAGLDGGTDAAPSVPDYDALDTAIQQYFTAHASQGLAVGVIMDGHLAWTKTYGTKSATDANAGPISTKTLFPTIALSSTATATAALQLVGRGDLAFDAPVIETLPGLTVLHGKEWLPQLTLRHLLNVRSGISLPSNGIPWSEGDDDALMGWVLSEFGKTNSLIYPPGEIAVWSFLNPVIQAAMIEVASGQKFAAYMKQHLFEPLGMVRTTYGRDNVEADGDYARSKSVVSNAAIVRPMLTEWSSLEDVAKYLAFLLNGNETVLPNELRQLLLTPQTPNSRYLDRVNEGYGVVLVTEGFAGKEYYPYAFRSIGHGDALYDYSASWRLVPSRGFGMVLLSNSVGYDQADELFVKAFEVILGEPPVSPGTAKEEISELDKYVGEYSTLTKGLAVVSLTDGGLRMTWSDGVKQCDLVQVSPGHFACDIVYGEQTWFWGQEDGQADHLCTFSFVGHRTSHWDAGADAAGE